MTYSQSQIAGDCDDVQVSRQERHSSHQRVESLYKHEYVPLVRYLKKTFGKGPPAPEDIAQQAFERLIKSGSMAGVENPAGYLWRVARNLAITLRRSEDSRVEREQVVADLEVDSYQMSPERVLLGERAMHIAREVIRKMPATRRQALVLVRMQGMTQDQAAEHLQISRPAVSKHVAIAIAQIAKAIANES